MRMAVKRTRMEVEWILQGTDSGMVACFVRM
jgi:hypothetical protein